MGESDGWMGCSLLAILYFFGEVVGEVRLGVALELEESRRVRGSTWERLGRKRKSVRREEGRFAEALHWERHESRAWKLEQRLQQRGINEAVWFTG